MDVKSSATALNSTAHKPKLEALTSLRGIAAVVVVLAHIQISFPLGLEYVVHWHNAAVDLFFVLSGFTLFYVYGLLDDGQLRYGRYLLARYARVYPLYLLSLALVGLLYVWPRVIEPTSYPLKVTFVDFLAQLLGINAWPLVGNGVHWNLPTWSISAELFCYILLFPLLFRLGRIRSDRAILVGTAVLAFLSFVAFVGFYDPRIMDTRLQEASGEAVYWVAVIRSACGFACGWLIYCAHRNKGWLSDKASQLFTPLCLLVVALIIAWPISGLPMHTIVLLFPLLILGAARPTGPAARLLDGSTLRFLGEISYSLYIFHMLLYILFVNTLGMANGWGFRIYALYLMTLLLVSSLSYFAFEQTLRRRINRLAFKRS
ncbi:acyltransferase [Aureimonas sp. AU20]|uniref:acyltransferase family protein n=1 Tax=Aureimonas sp. AU20 TaxID=1349819 RepID=UPI0007219676|nr:acyltransferase [Aureimonas sp. AU20]ALN75773.1 hypothetical protein M673_23760 [Aureimonas sp. AU20]